MSASIVKENFDNLGLDRLLTDLVVMNGVPPTVETAVVSDLANA
jgi:hypothetical protein